MAKRHSNKSGDLESLFLRLEELVLANSGENEFEVVFKLVVAKLWDERCGKESRFTAYSDHTTTYRNITTLLQEAERAWNGVLEGDITPGLTPEHLQICVEVLTFHRLSGTSFQVFDAFFEFLVSRGAKGVKGQFFTPRHVIELCVRMLGPKPTDSILDPACGSGGFLVHAFNHVRTEYQLSGKALQDYASMKLWGFDMDSRAIRVARALMVLAGDGRTNIVRLNSLLKPETGGLFAAGLQRSGFEDSGSTLTIEDLTRSRLRNHKGFDIILTNPPFAGEVRERQVMDEYDLSVGRQRIERDILFVERCVELLRPGGRMAIVLPHNKFAVDSATYVRTWLLRKTHILAVVGLGRNTFLPHTHQKASVLFLQKRIAGGAVDLNQEVFFAISERDGKNSKGQPLLRRGAENQDSPWFRLDHDFEEILEGFKVYREARQTQEGD